MNRKAKKAQIANKQSANMAQHRGVSLLPYPNLDDNFMSAGNYGTNEPQFGFTQIATVEEIIDDNMSNLNIGEAGPGPSTAKSLAQHIENSIEGYKPSLNQRHKTHEKAKREL